MRSDSAERFLSLKDEIIIRNSIKGGQSGIKGTVFID